MENSRDEDNRNQILEYEKIAHGEPDCYGIIIKPKWDYYKPEQFLILCGKRILIITPKT